MTATFTAASTGSRAGATVVPVYVHQPVRRHRRAAAALGGVRACRARGGRVKVVHVSFPVSELAVTPADIEGTGRPTVESGDYQVQVGNQTANFSITG